MTTTRGRIRVEAGQKRVRAYLGGDVVADGIPLLVWERPYYPTYYFPMDGVRSELLIPTGATQRSPSRGIADVYTVKSGTTEAADAAYLYPDSPVEELRDTIAFRWDAMDHWFEEDEEVFVHARDPYTRVDILQSSRHVQVIVDGVTVADTRSPRLLFETGLPVRYYVPKPDVRLDLLTPSDTVTHCPYKGAAEYWTVAIDGTAHEDIVWGYRSPVRESAAIAGYVSFYNEKVDVVVDGLLQDRPKTLFS